MSTPTQVAEKPLLHLLCNGGQALSKLRIDRARQERMGMTKVIQE